ncbi:uncharacterized protein YktA (UPF0223 family) [Virgibacillus halotolerans]|uniref:UPF0223 family protein n=1 Tax=Virgibacillus halotolerans TaxID=1071053 RepID=UPI0019611EB7|nr:UPF0223 family protein [Virgibacillus halotolerans]MBM7598732.1 uncharacterized protein YktA (UPF0223 family) [Virgibacillus halotolerans]
MGYHYPIDETWTKEEVVDVVNFFSLVEKGYEKSVNRDELILLYKRFKQIVPSKSEEKKLFSAFESASGYSSYHLIKKARASNENKIKM